MKKLYLILLTVLVIFFLFSEFLLIKNYFNQKKFIKDCQKKYEILKDNHDEALLQEKFQGADIPLKMAVNKKFIHNSFRHKFWLIIYFSMNDCETCINEKLISLNNWQSLLQKYGCNIIGVTGSDFHDYLFDLRTAFNIKFPIYEIEGFDEKIRKSNVLLTPAIFFAYGDEMKTIYTFNSQINNVESFHQFLIKIKSILNSGNSY